MNTILNYQIVLMFNPALPQNFDFMLAATKVKELEPIFSNTTPMMVPLDATQGAPLELPRVIYQLNGDTIQLSLNTFTFSYALSSGEDFLSLLGDKITLVNSFLDIIAEWGSSRFGIVINGTKNQENMKKTLEEKLADNQLSKFDELEFSYYNKIFYDDKPQGDYVNNWTRYYYKSSESQQNFVFDFNTPTVLEKKNTNLKDYFDSNLNKLIKEAINEK